VLQANMWAEETAWPDPFLCWWGETNLQRHRRQSLPGQSRSVTRTLERGPSGGTWAQEVGWAQPCSSY